MIIHIYYSLSLSVKITVFYIIYYLFLAGFFIAMLLIFKQTLSDDEPKWLGANGIIGDNPGTLPAFKALLFGLNIRILTSVFINETSLFYRTGLPADAAKLFS